MSATRRSRMNQSHSPASTTGRVVPSTAKSSVSERAYILSISSVEFHCVVMHIAPPSQLTFPASIVQTMHSFVNHHSISGNAASKRTIQCHEYLCLLAKLVQ